jgi:membrane protease YdiL (CAAX protease family)
MRPFLGFLGLFAAGFAAMALLTYPAWALLHPHFDFPFHRVGTRIGMLVLIAGFVVAARRMRLADRTSLGYGTPRASFVRDLLLGMALGLTMMLPVVIAVDALDLRQWRDGMPPGAAGWALLTLEGLLRGLAVSFIEETFLRGALFTAVARSSGTRAAIAATALIYSALHFFGQVRIPAEEVTYASGFTLLAGTLSAFAHPLSMLDAFLSLAAVGVVLGIVRALTGNIAACIGLHAGWVCIITLVRDTSVVDRDAPGRFLVSDLDGFVGWLVLAWTVIIGGVIAWIFARRRRVPGTLA